ncbi:NAD(P)/FAD-dependent oxidoreductase [Quadrisphaera sp. INWT6]|uniref:NAD(P)/FAD-dependent oxidoreductase n=1 Tax=Quadrisphaera sp. INWT6 TaxID=2596917 RepID=UPI0018927FA2|nr:NAD(P)/FAD-dependent oxidoreductase [Quadrisphaera sp. INWT6]MBF5082031.1 NAD(P)/FAD-dependent oxidoreductase [Quadrisphaera sp. INWT6]
MSTTSTRWDLVVVGAGPAGASAALGALAQRADARVLLLDRADFPRDKVCGDGVAPHALDVLETVGVTGLLDDWPVAPRLRISVVGTPGVPVVEQAMSRPAQVVPRAVLDERVLRAALDRGAVLRRARVRDVHQDGAGVGVVLSDGEVVRARVVVGADGAHSEVRRALGPAAVPPQRPGTTAIAVRAYAPVLPEHDGVQVLAFSEDTDRPSYAWSFPVGDGRANVGFGQLVDARSSAGAAPTRARLLERLEELLPGTTAGAEQVAGHPLPLSTGRSGVWSVGRVLLAGDAASLVNPVTGEGIYYAVLSGVLAGRAALGGGRYDRTLREALAGHLRHTDVAARLVRSDRLLHAALRASSRDAGVFDDVADIGLARGRLTGRVVRGMGRALLVG